MSVKQSNSQRDSQETVAGAKATENNAQSLNKNASGEIALEGDEDRAYDVLLGYHLPTSSFKFKAQTASLIESVSLSQRKYEDFEDFHPRLKQHLLNIPSSGPLTLENSRSQLQKSGIRVPLSDPSEPVNWKFGFIPPKEVDVVGSWSLKNGISKRKNQHATIDLLIQIPPGVLQSNDFADNRYFHKRAHYLAHIAKSFFESSFSDKYEYAYSYLEGDSFKPVIAIEPRKVPNASPWTARLILSYPQSFFPVSKLAPSKSNLKLSQNPTPHYNQSILMDSNDLQLKYHSFFKDVSNKYSAFSPACQLVKVWAQRKAFYRQSKAINRASNQSQSLIGFGRFGWLINFLVANILLGTEESSQKTHSGGSILHSDPALLFKKVIDWLADWKLDENVRMKAFDSPHALCDEEFSAFECVLIDPTGLINLTAEIPMGTLKLLRASAERTASLLKSGNDVFAAVFPCVLCSFASSFDYHFIIRISDEDIRRLCQKDGTKTILRALQILSRYLQIALGNRVTGFALLCQFLDASLRLDRASSSCPSHLSDSIAVSVGLTLDQTHAFDLTTIGPPPDPPSRELKEFIDFWSPRSELHRFKNGSIEQSVIWEVSHPLERMQIVKQVVRWLLIEKLKFRDDRSTVWDLISDFDDLIFEDPNQVSKIYQKDPKLIGFNSVMKAFDQLAKQLKSLKDPLSITSVVPVSEYLRYSSVFIPGPRQLTKYDDQDPTTKYLPRICCQLRFESMGKWPEELEEIQIVKSALLCKIGDTLKANGEIIDCSLEYDYNALPIAQNVTLDVLHSSGYAFSLMICYEREEMLLEEVLTIDEKDTRTKLSFETSWALAALSQYRKTFLESRKHHEGIVALQARFPSFTYTVRLIKRWFSTHMLLSTHISIELVELLASVVYLLSEDELPPTTGISGFIRFLRFLKLWDWRHEPLLLPIRSSVGLSTNSLTHFPEDLLKSAVNNFDSIRKKDLGFHQVTYFVATEDDLSGTRWMLSSPTSGHATDKEKKAQTTFRPNGLIADRIQALATASIKVLDLTLKRGPIDFETKTIFKSPLNDYDFHLILDLSCSTRLHQSLLPFKLPRTSRSKDLHGAQTLPEIEYDPVLAFVKELQLMYGDWIEFFYDEFGGPLIGGVMNRTLLEMEGRGRVKRFKPTRIGYLIKLDDDKSASNQTINGGDKKEKRPKVMFDLDAALFEIFEGIGNGLVVKILKKGVDYQ